MCRIACRFRDTGALQLEIALVLVGFDHVASPVVNANLQRLWRRIQNADAPRTIWQKYERTAATSTAGSRNVSTTSAERVAQVTKNA